jgi:hypothetical protein
MPHQVPISTPARTLLLALWWAAAPSVGLAQAASGSGSIFTCVDAQGRVLSSDRPIPECRDRVQRELNRDGSLRRIIQPPPTPEERERQAARERAAAEAAAREAEERRREAVLLARYPNEAAHQRARAAALQQIQAVIDAAQQHAERLEQERRRLDDEMEFYRSDPASAPPALKARLADNAQQRQAQALFLADQQREKVRVEERFDAELLLLQRLWSANPAGTQANGR